MRDRDEMNNSAIEKVEDIAEKKKIAEENSERREEQATLRADERLREREERKVKRESRRRAREAKAQNAEMRRESIERSKAERRESREENRENKRSGGYGGWLAAVVALSLAVIVLGSLLATSTFTDALDMNKTNAVENSSQRSFYDFVGYVDNIETNMSKLFVSTDDAGRQRILGDIIVQGNLADASLAALPLTDESKFYTSKYINQVSDYAKYLNNRLIDGYTLTQEDYANLRKLYDANVKLKGALSSLSSRIDENYDFDMLTDRNESDIIISQFNDLEENARDYPEMIYDGPFSDGLEAQEPKGLTGEEINEIQAKEKFEKIFGEYGLEKTQVSGKAVNSKIECFCVTADTDRGNIFAQFSVKGGHLVTFSSFKECERINLGEEECVGIAERFLESVGLKNMRCVWMTEDENTVRLNFAYTIGDITIYPDMVKVNVCRENGRVIGMDADLYYINHTERKDLTPKYSRERAEEKVAGKIDILSRGLAVTPKGNGKEILAYEFIGLKDGETYYVYIDANTLKESDVFKMVETEEGLMLL